MYFRTFLKSLLVQKHLNSPFLTFAENTNFTPFLLSKIYCKLVEKFSKLKLNVACSKLQILKRVIICNFERAGFCLN